MVDDTVHRFEKAPVKREPDIFDGENKNAPNDPFKQPPDDAQWDEQEDEKSTKDV
jgi:hypothetical protein